ncbi:MAG TPA: DUF6111 family protein [Stellaceae bacterium]|nr:DUF6111 family protein [Stellaceae bacterium]
MRVFLTIVLPLLLPTALYVLWTIGAGRFHLEETPEFWRELPFLWLALAGMVLTLALVVSVAELGGAKNGVYVPPHLENGTIVPGRLEPEPGH